MVLNSPENILSSRRDGLSLLFNVIELLVKRITIWLPKPYNIWITMTSPTNYTQLNTYFYKVDQSNYMFQSLRTQNDVDAFFILFKVALA